MGVEEGFGYAAKEGGNADFVCDVDAGGAAADGVDSWEVVGCPFEHFLDSIKVPLGIGLRSGIPWELVAVGDFAILDSGDLDVAGPEVEADAAAGLVSAEGGGGFLCGREDVGGGSRGDGEWFGVDAPAHEVGVEPAGGGVFEVLIEVVGDVVRASDVDVVCASGPEGELGEAFGEGAGLVWREGAQIELEVRDGGWAAFECQVEDDPGSGGEPETCRMKLWVEWGSHLGWEWVTWGWRLV